MLDWNHGDDSEMGEKNTEKIMESSRTLKRELTENFIENSQPLKEKLTDMSIISRLAEDKVLSNFQPFQKKFRKFATINRKFGRKWKIC